MIKKILTLFFLCYSISFTKSNIISGKITDTSGQPLSNVLIRAVNDKKLVEIYSKKNGEFSFPYTEGIISIFVEKDGFYGAGTSIFTKENSDSKKINLKLEKKNFFLSGSLANGINFIKNAKVDLYDVDKRKVIASTTSNDEGFYNFSDLPFIKNAILKVNNHSSEVFSLNKDFANFNIFFNQKKEL